MPELTDAEIAALLSKGLGRPAAVEGKPSPLAGPPSLPVVAPQEGYQPGVGLVVNIPGATSANAPATAAPAGTPAVATPAATPTGTAPATGAPVPFVVPPIVAAAPTGPKPSEGMADLDTVMAGVWNTESGNRQIDPKTGKTITSPAGAIGVSQLMPDTARGLGGDPYDEQQNREMGKRYLSQMFDKYGNWRDATGAYFAGPGNYDKWLAAGSPRDSKIGAQITKYQDTALANAGILERGATAQRAPDGSRLLSDTDIHALMTQVPPQTPEEAARRTAKDDGILASIMDASKATTYSLYKGVRDFELGTVQAGLELASPDTAKALAARVKEVDAPWQPLLDKHSVLSAVGEVTGAVGALLGTARLLGPPVAGLAARSGMATVAREIAPKVPWLLQESGALTTLGRYGASVPVGAVVAGGTVRTESGNPMDRVLPAVLGGIAGPLGVALGQGVSKAMSVASSKGELARAMAGLKANADALSPDLNYLKDVAVSRISGVEQEAARRYGAATTTGKTVRGLDAGTLDDTITGYNTKAASQIDATKQALRDKMGLLDEGKARAQSAVQHQQFADQTRAVQAAQESYIDRLMSRAGVTAPREPQNAAIRAQFRSQLTGDPAFPQVSMAPPEPYVPGTITAEQFMHGRQFLADQMRRAGTRAKRNQIAGLKQELDKSFAQAAKDAGMTAGEFYRKLLLADKYYKSQVVPAHDVMETLLRGKRWRGSERIKDDAGNLLTAGADGTKIFDRVVKTVESGTDREVQALLHVFGSTPRDTEKLVRSLAYRALTKAQGGIGKDFDPAAVRKYIDDNHTNLARVLSPEQYKWMKGFANLVETVSVAAKNAESKGAHRFWRGSNFLLIIGAEHMFRGDFLHGAELIASGMAAHTLFHSVPSLRNSLPLNRLVRNAADLHPGSEELNRLSAQIEWQYAKRLTASARYIGEKAAGGPSGPRIAPPGPPPPQQNVPLPH